MICSICPRRCGALRTEHHGEGFCGMGTLPVAARIAPHFGEEPCISGTRGSGTVFFSGCTMRCVFCQNHAISLGGKGVTLTPRQLADGYKMLEESGVHNINLVTADHFVPAVVQSLEIYRPNLPVVYNCSGYQSPQTLKMLDGLVDIYLPDIKYFSPELASRYSAAPDYFEHAAEAVREMIRQAGELRFNDEGGLVRGTVIRHLVLPGCRHDSMRIMEWIAENTSPEQVLVSIMNQYTPFDFVPESFPELKRRVTKMEYNSVVRRASELGLEGFTQEKSSADAGYVPDFDLSGL